MNGGLSIGNRPRFPEPGTGSIDIADFDNKYSEEYAKLDEARAAYDVARGDSPTSPERNPGMNPIYRGVPNYSKNEKKAARRLFLVHCCIFSLFLTNILALALGGFALANTISIGTLTGSDDETVQLQQEITELRNNLSALRDMNKTIEYLRSQSLPQNCSCASAPTVSATLPGVTSTPSPTVTTPPPVISLYENCTTEQKSSCILNAQTLLGDIASLPMFATCTTAPIPAVSDEDENFMAGVSCSIDEEQNMPVSSTLLFADGAYSCICTAIEIPNLVQDTLNSFECGLYMTVCPAQIRFPGD